MLMAMNFDRVGINNEEIFPSIKSPDPLITWSFLSAVWLRHDQRWAII